MQLNSKIEVGEIIKTLESGEVKVKIKRNAKCGGCSYSALCHPFGKDFMIITALNTKGAKIGDKVEVGFSVMSSNKAVLILYIIPLIFFIMGAILGFYINPFHNKDLSSSLSGIFLLIISFLGIYLYHKLLIKDQPQLTPTIIRIIDEKR